MTTTTTDAAAAGVWVAGKNACRRGTRLQRPTAAHLRRAESARQPPSGAGRCGGGPAASPGTERRRRRRCRRAVSCRALCAYVLRCACRQLPTHLQRRWVSLRCLRCWRGLRRCDSLIGRRKGRVEGCCGTRLLFFFLLETFCFFLRDGCAFFFVSVLSSVCLRFSRHHHPKFLPGVRRQLLHSPPPLLRRHVDALRHPIRLRLEEAARCLQHGAHRRRPQPEPLLGPPRRHRPAVHRRVEVGRAVPRRLAARSVRRPAQDRGSHAFAARHGSHEIRHGHGLVARQVVRVALHRSVVRRRRLCVRRHPPLGAALGVRGVLGGVGVGRRVGGLAGRRAAAAAAVPLAPRLLAGRSTRVRRRCLWRRRRLARALHGAFQQGQGRAHHILGVRQRDHRGRHSRREVQAVRKVAAQQVHGPEAPRVVARAHNVRQTQRGPAHGATRPPQYVFDAQLVAAVPVAPVSRHTLHRRREAAHNRERLLHCAVAPLAARALCCRLRRRRLGRSCAAHAAKHVVVVVAARVVHGVRRDQHVHACVQTAPVLLLHRRGATTAPPPEQREKRKDVARVER
eukprot:Rhum_TRINITY_DN14902_c3_g1::Rhum_TRINITY_DN14902_c3_g1_i1::g.127133::m.127133